ncbi:MAG: hypothetical protein J6O90_04665 [Candidatus Methanomethylophilaceae archaeon]|nr:hypothetical protein [Candidatus Methanomethylophilaceae archaeon]
MTDRYITLAEVKELLAAEQEKRLAEAGPSDPADTESDGVFSNPSTKNAMEHAQIMTKGITAEQAVQLKEEALAIGCVNNSESIACKIADILPRYPVDVRAIFSKERITLSESDINEILELVAKYI